MKKTTIIQNDETRSKRRCGWFDLECQANRKTVRALLHRFHTDKSYESRKAYIEARREYKQLLQQKRRSYATEKSKFILNHLNTPSLFWKEITQCLK